MSERGDITQKTVAVGLLARHGFDLTRCVGTLLAPKFDFTGASGILAAYRAAFGQVEELETVLSAPRLSRAAATRHVIVHRAGTVDSEYLRRVADTAQQEGDRLYLPLIEVGALLVAMINAVEGVTLFVDRHLLAAPG